MSTLLRSLKSFKPLGFPLGVLQDGGNGYRAYVFEESTRRCAIDRKGQGRKEVIYLRVADVSCTRGVRGSMGLSHRGPCGGVP